VTIRTSAPICIADRRPETEAEARLERKSDELRAIGVSRSTCYGLMTGPTVDRFPEACSVDLLLALSRTASRS
jgi:hypothetical protein